MVIENQRAFFTNLVLNDIWEVGSIASFANKGFCCWKVALSTAVSVAVGEKGASLHWCWALPEVLLLMVNLISLLQLGLSQVSLNRVQQH